MFAIRAAFLGLGRVLSSPKVVVWVWLANLLAAVPPAILVTQAIHESIGDSRIDEPLREGFDMGWYGEYRHGAEGLAATFTPTHSGPGAFFANLDSWFRGDLFLEPWGLVAFGIGWALLWVLLAGGVLEQFVRPVPVMALERFLASGGRHFPRLLRLAVLSAPLYYGIYRLARKVFPWIRDLTRDVTVESTVLLCYLAGAAAIVFLLLAVRMVFDYAKISIVADERRSALLAAGRGVAFVLRRPLRTFGVVFVYGLLGALCLAGYAAIAPGSGQSNWAALIGALLVAQGYLAVKLILRLGLLGAEVVVYSQPSRRMLPPPL